VAVKWITTVNKLQSVVTTRNRQAVYLLHRENSTVHLYAAPTDPGHGDDCVLVGSVAVIWLWYLLVSVVDFVATRFTEALTV